jgi:hypothetical protein
MYPNNISLNFRYFSEKLARLNIGDWAFIADHKSILILFFFLTLVSNYDLYNDLFRGLEPWIATSSSWVNFKDFLLSLNFIVPIRFVDFALTCLVLLFYLEHRVIDTLLLPWWSRLNCFISQSFTTLIILCKSRSFDTSFSFILFAFLVFPCLS